MKKLLLVGMLSTFILTGCATFGDGSRGCEPVTVKQVEYVVKIPPKELMTVPQQVEPVDLEAAKQSDIAAWIIRNEQRTKILEDMLRGLAQFFQLEQIKLDAEAAAKNSSAKKSADTPTK